eukprot:11682803-Alexandrium_andersonii.AAC.1
MQLPKVRVSLPGPGLKLQGSTKAVALGHLGQLLSCWGHMQQRPQRPQSLLLRTRGYFRLLRSGLLPRDKAGPSGLLTPWP